MRRKLPMPHFTCSAAACKDHGMQRACIKGACITDMLVQRFSLDLLGMHAVPREAIRSAITLTRQRSVCCAAVVVHEHLPSLSCS